MKTAVRESVPKIETTSALKISDNIPRHQMPFAFNLAEIVQKP